MGKNCLVLETIGASDNPNLLGVGEIVFEYMSTGGFVVQQYAAKGLTVSILTPGVTFTNAAASGQTTQSLTAAGQQGERTISVSGACKVSLTKDKYNLLRLRDSNGYLKVDLASLEYAVELENLLLRGLYSNALSTGDIASLKHCDKLNSMVILSPMVHGSISDLPDSGLLTVISMGSSESEHSNIEGDISVLATKMPNATNITLPFTKVSGNISSLSSLVTLTALSIKNTVITGSLNSFLDAMYNSGNGRTSGTLTVNAQGSGVTYNGNPITDTLTVTFSSSGWSIA